MVRFVVTRPQVILGRNYAAGEIFETPEKSIAAQLSSDYEGLLAPIYDAPGVETHVAVTSPSVKRKARKGA
jgi:hypothetical protein